MDTEDNVVEFTGEWQGETQEMSDDEYASAMQELLEASDVDALGRTVAGVLEFLAVRAFVDGPYYIVNEDSTAITVIATNDNVTPLIDVLPENFRSWEDVTDEAVDFIQHNDPGDEQHESASESE